MKLSIISIKVLIFSFILIVVLPISTSLSATEKTLPLSSYFSQTWSTNEGLPHSSINAISQTSDGYLWIATWEGLARFNGREFNVFKRGSEIGLPDSLVKSLTPTLSGKLLVAGARGGILERYKNKWSQIRPAKAMVNHAIYDSNKDLWLALEGKGLIYRNMNTNQDKVIINNISAYKILQDNNGVTWVATNRGLFSVTNKTSVHHFTQKYGLPEQPIHDILLTHKNHLIIATQQGAYELIDGHFEPLHSQLINKRINNLLEDSAHNLWIGTDNNGIFRLSDNNLEQLNEKNGLPSNKISALYQDKEQSIWAGTSSGLFRLREVPFITLTTKEGLSGNYIHSVLSHSDGSLWVGNSKGLNKIDKNEISTINVANKDKQLSILSLAETSNKQVLVGTYNNGLYITTKNGLQELMTVNNGLPSNEVRTILVDSAKNTWVGTTSGLIKISVDNTLEIINNKNGLPANLILALAEDKFNNIWIATVGGVAFYNKGVIQNYPFDDKFDAEYALSFHVTQDSLWMATDRGLIHLDLNTQAVKSITKKHGLPVDKILQIVEDNTNTFWLISDRGVINVAKNAIINVLQEKSKYVDYKFFSRGLALLNVQINGGSTPSATLHTDNNVWISTAKGVSHIDEKRLQKMAKTTIPVVIEKLEVDGNAYPILPLVTLPKGTSLITIHYAGLGYLMPKHIIYQTKLIGFDKEWKNKHNKTFTEFTNLPPGNYTFQMRAKYPNGRWNESLAEINFIITPYYWQTTWFKLFIIINIIILPFIINRYRTLSIQRTQERLKTLVAQQTIELQKQTELFSYQAKHDQLTGLYNRRAFDEWCCKDFEAAKLINKPLSMAILDIDHFKSVNDDYSHLIGDEVIKKIANTLQELTEENSLNIRLARWGGEEFTLLINHDVKKAYDFCELVRLTIQHHDFYDVGDNINITISIGLTDNSEIIEYDQMLNHADQALYFAKHNGRNQVKIYQAKDHENNEKVNNRINKITRIKPRKD